MTLLEGDPQDLSSVQVSWESQRDEIAYTDFTLKDIFKVYGTVDSVVLPTENSAIITFRFRDSAKKAVLDRAGGLFGSEFCLFSTSKARKIE